MCIVNEFNTSTNTCGVLDAARVCVLVTVVLLAARLGSRFVMTTLSCPFSVAISRGRRNAQTVFCACMSLNDGFERSATAEAADIKMRRWVVTGIGISRAAK